MEMKKGLKPKRRRRCDMCHKLKETTHRREDPFQKEIWNKTVMRDLCDECQQECAWDI